MITVKRDGKIGFGDVGSPMAYAHTLSAMTGEVVKLEYHWKNGRDWKYKKEDPETLHDRTDTMFYEMAPGAQVVIEHHFNSKHDSKDDTFMDPRSSCHNTWRVADSISPVTRKYRKLIVVNSSDDNPMSLMQFDKTKTWKDPLALEDEWPRVFEELSKRRYSIIRVSYATPIDELRHWYSQAAMVLGYHGSTAWYAKAYMIPMLLFSQKPEVTSASFPWSCVRSSFNDVRWDDLPAYINTCKAKLLNHVSEYERYVGSTSIPWTRSARESCV